MSHSFSLRPCPSFSSLVTIPHILPPISLPFPHPRSLSVEQQPVESVVPAKPHEPGKTSPRPVSSILAPLRAPSVQCLTPPSLPPSLLPFLLPSFSSRCLITTTGTGMLSSGGSGTLNTPTTRSVLILLHLSVLRSCPLSSSHHLSLRPPSPPPSFFIGALLQPVAEQRTGKPGPGARAH